MNVAIFTNTYAPYVNGVANCVQAYRAGLSDAGHDVVIFAPWPLDRDISEDDPRMVRFPAVPAPGDYDYSLAVPFAPKVVRALKNATFNVVHTQHPVWVGAWGAWYARWAELPLVTTIHTQYELFSHLIPLPEPLVDMYLRMQVTRYCNKCHVVTTPAASARERLLQQGVTTPIEVIPNPIDIRRFADVDPKPVRQALGIDADEIVLGYIGRLAPEKNIEFSLGAIAMVMRKFARVRCVMVGGGVQLEPLQEQATKLGIADRTIFTGEVGHDCIADYQAALDVYVTASLSEGQPMAYTEALAAGTPLVALRAPGATDMVLDGENGVLVDRERGEEGMAEELARIVDDSAYLAQLSAGARKSAQRYDLATVTEQFVHVYALAAQRAQEADEDDTPDVEGPPAKPKRQRGKAKER